MSIEESLVYYSDTTAGVFFYMTKSGGNLLPRRYFKNIINNSVAELKDMMRKTIFLLGMAILSLLSYASPNEAEKDSTLVKAFATDNGAGLWGYYSPKDSIWIVPPCVHTMTLDSVVLKKGKTDYYFLGEVNSKRCVVNMDGCFIIPPNYDEVTVINYEEKLDFFLTVLIARESINGVLVQTTSGFAAYFQATKTDNTEVVLKTLLSIYSTSTMPPRYVRHKRTLTKSRMPDFVKRKA